MDSHGDQGNMFMDLDVVQGNTYKLQIMFGNWPDPDPIPGDADGSGEVDADDANALADNWLFGSGATWQQGDFNTDGFVDEADVTIMAANWGETGLPWHSPRHDAVTIWTMDGDDPGNWIEHFHEVDMTGTGGFIDKVFTYEHTIASADNNLAVYLEAFAQPGNWYNALSLELVATPAAAVPEPSVCVLLTGMLLLLVARRRQ